jgi:hypothetical protein
MKTNEEYGIAKNVSRKFVLAMYCILKGHEKLRV